MAKWDIDVQGAATVLKQVSKQAARFETKGKSLETALGDCVDALPNSPFVVLCVADYAEKAVLPKVEKVVGHTTGAIQGTADAVNHYVEGDLTMAAAAQRAARKAPVVAPPGEKKG